MSFTKSSGMAIFAVIMASIFALIIVGGIWFVVKYVSYSNQANATEQSIEAKYKNSQNVLSSLTTRVLEMVQVTDMYRDDLAVIIKGTFEGRYGADGSKAVFQFIQENNLPMSPELYLNVQRTIESGHLDFQSSQSVVIDEVATYKTLLGNVVSGFFTRMAGYPKVDLEKYNPVINSSVATQFETKVGVPMKLR